MPILKTVMNVKPPEKKVASTEYGDVYQALYNVEDNGWVGVTVEYTKENRIREIANVRRAAQRFFAQKDIQPKYRMASVVEPIDEYSATMFIQKIVR